MKVFDNEMKVRLNEMMKVRLNEMSFRNNKSEHNVPILIFNKRKSSNEINKFIYLLLL